MGEIGPLRTENGEEKGTPPPPTTNTPNDQGVDPHGPDFSETPAGQKQIARFLLTGRCSRSARAASVLPRRLEGQAIRPTPRSSRRGSHHRELRMRSKGAGRARGRRAGHTEEDTGTHDARAAKAAYLRKKLEERAEAERKADED